MTYYINPIWFYIMNIGDTLKNFLFIAGTVTSISVGIFYIFDFIDECDKSLLKKCKKIIVASIIAIVISIFVPSKVTCIEMMVASQVTHENISDTKEGIYEFIDYISDKVDGKEKEK